LAPVFTTAPFLRPLGGLAYKPADTTFSPRAAQPGEWRGGGARADAAAGGQPGSQVVHDSLQLGTVDLDCVRHCGRA